MGSPSISPLSLLVCLRHFGYGGAATSASRPSSLFLLFAPQLSKTDLEGRGGGQSAPEGMRVGSEASRERLGTWGGGSGLAGALPMEMAPDGPGLPPRPPFLRSLVWATRAGGSASDF